jgi:hypothetical protein
MRILFPYDPLDERQADGPFREEYLYLQEKGVDCSLFDYDSLLFNEFKPRPKLTEGEIVLYRGWMIGPNLYEVFVKMVEENGGKMLSSKNDFIKSHHLPGWYESFKDLTPESKFFDIGSDIVNEAAGLGWEKYFVKDYVKSNYNERGSIANSPSEVKEILSLIQEHRGAIEGGISLRKVEEFNDASEVRYFVFNKKPYSPNNEIPEIVKKIALLHQAIFYSVDIVQRSDGQLRLIEIGDGQVSDRKSWQVPVFCNLLIENS